MSLQCGQRIERFGTEVPGQVGLGSHHNDRPSLSFIVKRKGWQEARQSSREQVTGMVIGRLRGQAGEVLAQFPSQLRTARFLILRSDIVPGFCQS